MNEAMIKMLMGMLPKDLFRDVKVSIEWEEEDENTLLLYVRIEKNVGEPTNTH